ncbi:MAG: hypothetical protein QF593_14600 [Nitrospinota bacterium]|nr:hypothetical protein [Nitrospinota bacterium]
MGVEGQEFFGESGGDVHENRRMEIPRARSLVEQDVGHEPGGGYRGVAKVPAILVGVLTIMDENDIRPDLLEEVLDAGDEDLTDLDLGVFVIPDKQSLRLQDLGRLFLLGVADLGVAPRGAGGENEKVDVVARAAVARQGPAASELDIVRMGADCQDVNDSCLSANKERAAAGPQ